MLVMKKKNKIGHVIANTAAECTKNIFTEDEIRKAEKDIAEKYGFDAVFITNIIPLAD